MTRILIITLAHFVFISANAQINLSITGDDISCFNECNGTLNAQAFGGTAPFSYVWNDGRTDAQRTGLCPGNYSVTVTDSLGATASGGITLYEPASALSFVFDSTATLAQNPCTGTAWVTVSGGTSPYTYAWDGFAGYSTIDTAYNLCQREHCVTVTDDNGCIETDCVSIPLNLSTAVYSESDNHIKVWPNPASDIINVRCENCDNLVIISLSGKEIFGSNLRNNFQQINISNFPEGIYILRCEKDNEFIFKKIKL